MSVRLSDLRAYGSAVMPNDDTTTEIGGVIDKQKKVVFTDVGGGIQVVSSESSDVSPLSVTVHYRDAAGQLLNETRALHATDGKTPVPFTATPERLLRAIKSGTMAGDIAVEAQTAERSNTAAGPGEAFEDTIELDAGASASDGAYDGMVIRLTGGTGAGQIRQIVNYVGATKIATVDHVWDVVPDNTTVFRIAPGFYLEKDPSEVMESRRPFYDVASDTPGGSDRKYYEKIYLENGHATLALLVAKVQEITGGISGFVAFALEQAIPGSDTNGAGNNRQVAPSGYTFNSADKDVFGGDLGPGDAQGVWMELSLDAGEAATNSFYVLRLAGKTV